jgi:hypothetical protein
MQRLSGMTRITLTAGLGMLMCSAALAQQMKSTADANAYLDRQCREWSVIAKKGANGSDADRTAAANQASLSVKVAIEVVQFAPAVSDADIASSVSRFRTCLDKAGVDVFGAGSTVTVSFNPRMKNAKLPRTLDAEIKAYPAAKKAAAVTPPATPAAGSGSGSAAAGGAPGAKAALKEADWTATLGGGDVKSLDGKPWDVEIFDAVACKSLSKVTLAAGGSATVTIKARELAGQAINKGELGAHFRWQTSGQVPLNGKPTQLCFWGDPKPVRDGASTKLVIYPANGTGKCPGISGNCDKIR